MSQYMRQPLTLSRLSFSDISSSCVDKTVIDCTDTYTKSTFDQTRVQTALDRLSVYLGIYIVAAVRSLCADVDPNIDYP